VDGIKGRRTNAALVQYQKNNGLPIDLRLSQSLIDTLSERYVEKVKK
jgi:peptidoglycan hydrolase-like protein with peptidoglycan-binding domain